MLSDGTMRWWCLAYSLYMLSGPGAFSHVGNLTILMRVSESISATRS